MISGREPANGTSQKIWNLGKRYENLGVCKTNWVIMTSPIRKSYVNDVCLWGLSFLCFPITCRHGILFAHEIMNKEVMIRLILAYEAGVASWRLKNKGISEWKTGGLLVYGKSMMPTISSIQHRPMVGMSSPDSVFWIGLSFEGLIFHHRHIPGYCFKAKRCGLYTALPLAAAPSPSSRKSRSESYRSEVIFFIYSS